jgi:hypothetical protein
MDLVNFFEKNQKLHIQIVVVTLKVRSCRTMSNKKKVKKSKKPRFYGQNKLFFENPSALEQFQPHGCMQELLRKYMKNELNTCFQQKFATGSYKVGIGRAWCSQKAREI